MEHEPPGWGQCRAGAQLCAWHRCCRSGHASGAGSKGCRRSMEAGERPGGMEMSPRGSAQHKGARWGGPRPSQHLATMFANTKGNLWRGRRRGGRGGLPASPPNRGLLELRSAPWIPHGTPDGGGRWAGAAPRLCRCLGAGARGAGSAEEECPRSMPTMPGLTALKSGCHIPSGQPFTSICGGLFGSRLIQPTQTALNPLAPAGPGRGLPAPSRELGTRMCRCHPAATSEGMM